MRASRASVFALAAVAGLALATARAAEPPARPGAPQRLTPARPAPAAAEPAAATEPAKEGGIEIAPLAPVDPAWSGILSPEQGAFPANMWEGTPRGFVAALLPRLPVTSSATLGDLARRLLLSNAAPPAGADGPGRPTLAALRLERIAASGRSDAFEAVAKTIPRAGGEGLDRLRIEQRLLAGDKEEACGQVAAGVRRYRGLWWDRALIACQALNGEHAKAALGLGLLREQKMPRDDAFDTLVDLAAGRPGKLGPLTEPSAFDVALLPAAKQVLPLETLEHAGPGLARALAADANLPAAQRLAAAERAAAFGALPPEKLRELYDSVDLPADEKAKGERGPRARALLYRAARAESEPKARAAKLQALLAQARSDGGFGLAARIAAPLFLELRPSPDLGPFAADAVRALYAAGRPADARAWLAVAEPSAAKALWPLARLAQGRETPWEADALGTWVEAAKADDAAASRAALALTLLAALDDPVDANAWTPLLDKAKPVAASLPATPVWIELPRAAAGKRLGETVLLSLLVLADGDRLTAQPAALAAGVAALAAAGLETEARAVAVEAALAAGL